VHSASQTKGSMYELLNGREPTKIRNLPRTKRSRRGAFYYECVVGRLKTVSLCLRRGDLAVIQQNLMLCIRPTDAVLAVRNCTNLEGGVSDYSTTVWLFRRAVACLPSLHLCQCANLLLARLNTVFKSQYPSGPRRQSFPIAPSC